MTTRIIYFSLIIGLLFAAAAENKAASFNFQSRSFGNLKRELPTPFAFNAKDTGDFKIGFAPEKGKKKPKMDADLQKSFQGLANSLNETFALPNDVYIAVGECGESNAFYDSGKKQLLMCYELYNELDGVFKGEYPKEAERDDAVSDAFVFIFFHELGHALIDVYELPITGKEEDAVDQLSTWILTDGTDGDTTAINGAIAFALLADEGENGLAFWDEHSLNQQRFYNTICLVYGNNPKKYNDFVKNGTLPKNRAARCTGEYAQIDRAWSKLLAPFVKK
jgi:hypothetical protein